MRPTVYQTRPTICQKRPTNTCIPGARQALWQPAKTSCMPKQSHYKPKETYCVPKETYYKAKERPTTHPPTQGSIKKCEEGVKEAWISHFRTQKVGPPVDPPMISQKDNTRVGPLERGPNK